MSGTNLRVNTDRLKGHFKGFRLSLSGVLLKCILTERLLFSVLQAQTDSPTPTYLPIFILK